MMPYTPNSENDQTKPFKAPVPRAKSTQPNGVFLFYSDRPLMALDYSLDNHSFDRVLLNNHPEDKRYDFNEIVNGI